MDPAEHSLVPQGPERIEAGGASAMIATTVIVTAAPATLSGSDVSTPYNDVRTSPVNSIAAGTPIASPAAVTPTTCLGISQTTLR